MPTVTITPATGGAPVYSNTANFAATGKWCEHIEIGPKVHAMEFIPSSAEDGMGSKDYGSRTREITMTVIYCNTSENEIRDAWITDVDGLSSSPSVITGASGTSLKRCFLNAGGTKISQPRSNPTNGNFWARATLSFTSRE